MLKLRGKKKMCSNGIRDWCPGKSIGKLAGCVGIGSGQPRHAGAELYKECKEQQEGLLQVSQCVS